MQNSLPSIGTTITRLRKERGWTQKELAERLEMHPNHVSRMEKGRLQPRRSTFEKLAEVFELELEDLEAVSSDDLSSRLVRADPELAALISQVPLLQNDQRDALRVFLRSMLTCQRLQHLASGKLV